MVELGTKEFYDEMVSRLNANEDFQAKTQDLDISILNVVEDRDRAFLLTVKGGQVSVAEAPGDAEATFKFIADYDTWVTNHEGQSLNKLVMTGKIRFKGSMPKIMRLQGKLKAIDETGQAIEIG